MRGDRAERDLAEKLSAEVESPFALSRQIRDLAPGRHICLLYQTFEEQMAVITPYFAEGLKSGQRCFYVSHDRTTEQVKAGLAHAGLDCDAAVAAGALEFFTAEETYLRGGSFDPGDMFVLLRDSQARALADGFSGTRSTGELTWALQVGLSHQELLDYENRLNVELPDIPHTGVCQYSRERFGSDLLIRVLQRHPIVFQGELVCPNPFFEPPFIAEEAAAGERLIWMLGRMVEARHRELAYLSALDEARHVEQLKKDLLSVISHELRTPLNSITGYGDILREGLAGPLTRQQAEFLDRIQDGADTLLGIVNDILDLSAGVTGTLALDRQPVEVETVLDRALAALRGRADRKKERIAVDAAPRLPRMDADAARVVQALFHLVDNAIKFSPAGATIRVRARRNGEAICFEVADQGPGIREVDRYKLFKPLTQLDMSSTRAAGGVGLGLALVKTVVEAHGGRVGLGEAGGGGTVVWFTIPISC